MRTGTDELGWRYNYAFKRRGWSSHAGFAGWGGWVRRREWVRLRCLRQPTIEEMPRETEQEARAAHTLEDAPAVLAGGTDDEILFRMLRVLGVKDLDRERLAVWRGWVEDKQETRREHLMRVLADDEKVRLAVLLLRGRAESLGKDSSPSICASFDIDRIDRAVRQQQPRCAGILEARSGLIHAGFVSCSIIYVRSLSSALYRWDMAFLAAPSISA